MRTGLTMPIKLRQIMERPRTGQNIAFSKLAELITSNFVARKASKENQAPPCKRTREVKNIRINSLKQPSLRPPSLRHHPQQQCFTEFF